MAAAAAAGQVLVDNFGFLRSGRPASFDMNSLAGACPALESRPADYCMKASGAGRYSGSGVAGGGDSGSV